MTGVPGPHDRAARLRSHGLLVLVVGASILVSLSATMINVVLPVIVRDLDATVGQASWLVLAYLVVQACTLVLAGQASDGGNPRRIFLVGLGMFVGMSCLLVLAHDPITFVVARAMQGLAAALILSNSASILATTYAGPALGRAMGLYLAGFAVAQAAGPTIGGLITSALGWRWMFVLVLGVGVPGLLVGPRLLRRLGPAPRLHGPVDLPGNVLFGACLAFVLVALSLSSSLGWTHPLVLGLFALGAGLVPLLWRVERGRTSPAIDRELMADGVFGPLNVAAGLLTVPRIVPIVLLSLWFQGVGGAPPWRAGLLVTALPVGVGLGSVLIRRVGQGRPERELVLPTALASAVATTALLPAVLWGEDWVVVAALFGVGMTTGLFSTASATTLLLVAPRDRLASANGIRTAFQLVGLTGGTAGLLSLVTLPLPDPLAQDFLAGRAGALDTAALGLVRDGYAVGLVVLAGSAWLAVALTVGVNRRQGRRPEPGHLSE